LCGRVPAPREIGRQKKKRSRHLRTATPIPRHHEGTKKPDSKKHVLLKIDIWGEVNLEADQMSPTVLKGNLEGTKTKEKSELTPTVVGEDQSSKGSLGKKMNFAWKPDLTFGLDQRSRTKQRLFPSLVPTKSNGSS